MSGISKLCNACGIDKNLDEFYTDSTKRDGRKNICKECGRLKFRVRRKTINTPEDVGSLSFAKIRELIFDITEIPIRKTCLSQRDADKISDICKQIINISSGSNEFLIDEFLIDENVMKHKGDQKNNIAVITSKIKLFLAIKKQLFDVSVSVEKHICKERSKLLLVTLPQGVFLNKEELEEFYNDVLIPNEQLFTECIVGGEGSGCIPMYEVIQTVSNFLKGQGLALNKKKLLASCDDDTWTFTLPQECALPKKEMKDLEDEISRFFLDYVMEHF